MSEPGSRPQWRASVLIDLEGYDGVVLWRVDRCWLIPISAAFTGEVGVSAGALVRLASDPPRLEESGLRVAVPDGDLAVTGTFGSGGPLEPVLGPHSYAVAAIKHDHRTCLLQAIHRGQRADQVDRDLRVSFARLFAALASPGSTKLLTRCNGRVLASSEELSDDHTPWCEASAAPRPPVDDANAIALGTLTHREREVLGHAITGATYHEIADALFVSVTTIQSHMRSILGKLGLHSRAQLIARCASAPMARLGVDVGDAAAHGGALSTPRTRLDH